MERAVFLVDGSGARLSCMLNPNTLVFRRESGIRRSRSIGGFATAQGLMDDPLLYTGGGRTELTLDLLFDIGVPGSTVAGSDVRDLTRPLWELSENGSVVDGYGAPAQVRFVWGKAWNFPGVVDAVSERLEHFTSEGVPRRSWLRMRLLRVQQEALPPGADDGWTVTDQPLPTAELAPAVAKPGKVVETRGRRMDAVATDSGYEPSFWRRIAEYNLIDDPLRVPAEAALRLPPVAP